MLTRNEIEEKDAWDLKPLYPSMHAWEEDFAKVSKEIHALAPFNLETAVQDDKVMQSFDSELLLMGGDHSQKVKAPPIRSNYGSKDCVNLSSSTAVSRFKGHLKEKLIEALDVHFALSRRLEKLYTYAHLRHDEEITLAENKVAQEKAQILLQKFAEETAWFEPEIFTIPADVMDRYLKEEKYCFHLQRLLRMRAHILSEREEELLALSGRALSTPHKAFSSINNADFKFQEVKDSAGAAHELTHAKYQIYMQSRDRLLRENAFKTLHRQYDAYENTLCDLISGEMLSHHFSAKARHFASSLEAALKPKNVPLQVYHTLIKAVRREISAHHAYVALRKEVMGLPQLHLFDMNVPLTKELELHYTYEEAESLVIESVAPLGKEYQEVLRRGLQQERWVDRFENKNKRSGAYSSGCFDSHPYVLMNYKNILRDVFTLAHECGHSMHSHLSHKNQPYHYSNYPIFVAEVASTFNEELLFQLMLKSVKTDEERIYLINSKIDDIRATLFRQAMFAEFELMMHECVEKEIPLTPQLLKEEYRKLVAFYFGPSVVIDKEIEIEWARIPHFYYDFYVYQYATGVSAALALSGKVLKGAAKEQQAYLSFLKGGSSKYPIDLLRLAGVDMEKEEPIVQAISHFRSLVQELETLLYSSSARPRA